MKISWTCCLPAAVLLMLISACTGKEEGKMDLSHLAGDNRVDIYVLNEHATGEVTVGWVSEADAAACGSPDCYEGYMFPFASQDDVAAGKIFSAPLYTSGTGYVHAILRVKDANNYSFIVSHAVSDLVDSSKQPVSVYLLLR